MISLSHLPPEYVRLFDPTIPFFCFKGGRGGGKTCCIAEVLVALMVSAKERNLVFACLRETQKTLQDSSKSVIIEAIERLGVSSLFKTSRTSDEIHCLLNGGVFKFRGLGTVRDADRIKSIHNVRWAWVDEAQTMKQEVWDIFVPSVRHVDAQIIVSFNPRYKTDFIYEDFVINPSKNYKVATVNYYTNPWFFKNHKLCTDMNDCYERYPDKFKHVWMGHTSSGFGQILDPRWWMRYDSLKAAIAQCTGSYITADTAYKTKTYHDYSVIQHWGYNRYHMYLLNQVRGKWTFPDLTKTIRKFTVDSTNLTPRAPPSKIYIEDKASGISLVQTLQDMGLFAVAWKPGDFNFPDDKVGRANEAAFLLERGCCYIPSNQTADWVRGFVNECADFDPECDGFDDQVDAFTMGVSVYRGDIGGGKMTNDMRQ